MVIIAIHDNNLFDLKKLNFETALYDSNATVVIPVSGKKVKYNKFDPIFDLEEPHPYASKKSKPPEQLKCLVCSKKNPKKST